MDIILNGTKYACPVAHEDPLFTIEIWQRIINEWDISLPEEKRDYFHLFCIMTGADFKTFVGTSENEVTIYNALRWFIESDYEWSNELPKVLSIGGRIVDVDFAASEMTFWLRVKSIFGFAHKFPKKVVALSAGQAIALRNASTKSKSWQTDKGDVVEYGCYAKAAAIYLQPLYSGERFNYDKVDELEQILLKMPAYLIRPIGFFTLASALPSGKSTTRHWLQTQNNPIRNFIMKLRDWLGRKGFLGSTMSTSLGNIQSDSLLLHLIRSKRQRDSIP